MALLLSAKSVMKKFGIAPLFENVSLSINDGDRLGLIGPNGSGKSTLLQILAGRIDPDDGEVALKKGTRLVYVPQDSVFDAGISVREVMRRALKAANVPEADWQGREAETLGRTGFEDFDQEAAALSGGWRKRLSIAEALVQDPMVLLLDEPTNHLDLAGIEWLEKLLANASFASVVISHDRYFLENVPTAMAELSRVYPGGLFAATGQYSVFLDQKADFLHAQTKRQDALEIRVRQETEWLRRGAKARTRKSKARIGSAFEMIGELADMRSRTQTATADIDFAESGRKTKRLIHLEQVSFGYDEKPLLDKLDFTLMNGVRVGLVGANGSGKSTLLKLLTGELEPQSGDLMRADNLRLVYFDQNRKLDETLTLKQALAPHGDSVIYRERVIHVASWASRFLFANEQLHQPVSKLSGGERARVLIANLMLEPADVLLLDEPTNDLDIPTLEILEESLLEFPGALVLVTHDRYLLDRVSTVVLGLDGDGNAGRFADYSQCESWLDDQAEAKRKPKGKQAPSTVTRVPESGKKKLSYMDARDYETIEDRVAEADAELESKRHLLDDASVTSNGEKLQAALAAIDVAQEKLDALYARWAELEAKR
jgi:ABC transport system ATP-binding/permease protein